MEVGAFDCDVSEKVACIEVEIKNSHVSSAIISRFFIKGFKTNKKSDREFQNELHCFNTFWDENGYDLTLSSWTEKFRDYINPEFLNGHNYDALDTSDNIHNDYDEQWSDHWTSHVKDVYRKEFLNFILIKDAENRVSKTSQLQIDSTFSIFNDCFIDIGNNSYIEHREGLDEISPKLLKRILNDLCLNISEENIEAVYIKFLTYSVNMKLKEMSIQNYKRPIHTYFDYDSDEINENKSNQKHLKTYIKEMRSSNSDSDISLTSMHHTDSSSSLDSTPEWITEKIQMRNRSNFSNHLNYCGQDISTIKVLKSYWYKRYSLFSKFDLGIQLDAESWYSVTPESIAQHVAQKGKCDTIVDAFCGVGGNTIQFALTCNKVIAIDIDPKKIEMAKHNAKIYGVHHKITFIVADFFRIYKNFRADGIFLSPPWGGPDYKNSIIYNLDRLQPLPLWKLLPKARKVSKNVIMYLPRNCDSYQIFKYAGIPKNNIEIEQNIISNNIIALSVYCGEFAY